MKRSPLQRKAPMSRGASALKRTAFKPANDNTPPARKAPAKRAAKKARAYTPVAEREHMGRVASLGCCVCRNLGFGASPAEVHHLRTGTGAGRRASNFDTIPLCPNHHRLGGSGVAIHAGKQSFEARYGTELELLEQTRRELGFTANDNTQEP